MGRSPQRWVRRTKGTDGEADLGAPSLSRGRAHGGPAATQTAQFFAHTRTQIRHTPAVGAPIHMHAPHTCRTHAHCTHTATHAARTRAAPAKSDRNQRTGGAGHAAKRERRAWICAGGAGSGATPGCEARWRSPPRSPGLHTDAASASSSRPKSVVLCPGELLQAVSNQ